jgi:RHS repeat-associated protein
MQTQRKYETARDLIDFIENKAGASLPTVSKYDYVNDTVGRRTAVETTGSAFSSTTRFNLWTYNTRSELTSSKRYAGAYDPTPDPGEEDEVTAERRLYNYDPIGNRIDATTGTGAGSTKYYCANALNQYLTLDDTDNTCPQSPADESFAYDLDGNLTLDATYEYTWDAENRLVVVEPFDDDGVKLVFDYDYMSRRIRKRVYTWNVSTADWNTEPQSDHRFVYDGWNVVLVLNGLSSNAVKTKHTWGLDLSGLSGDTGPSGIHGAGGIGGLLAVEETSTGGTPKCWFLYDAVGNVGQIVANASGYGLIAHYEYDPYGNTILADDVDSSGYAAANPFRFTTKWLDAQSGICYFGYRYYSPAKGRWATRDPIGEVGGYNLYQFVYNTPQNKQDPLGLASCYTEKTIRAKCSSAREVVDSFKRLGCTLRPVPRCDQKGGKVQCCDSGWMWVCRWQKTSHLEWDICKVIIYTKKNTCECEKAPEKPPVNLGKIGTGRTAPTPVEGSDTFCTDPDMPPA